MPCCHSHLHAAVSGPQTHREKFRHQRRTVPRGICSLAFSNVLICQWALEMPLFGLKKPDGPFHKNLQEIRTSLRPKLQWRNLESVPIVIPQKLISQRDKRLQATEMNLSLPKDTN